jgi:hypothetical protein
LAYVGLAWWVSFCCALSACLRQRNGSAQAAEAWVGHLRTHRGAHEVDLIVARGDRRVVALEVKLASVVDDHDVRHLRWLQEEMGDDLLDAVVITTGEYAYRRPDDAIAVIPAALLGP